MISPALGVRLRFLMALRARQLANSRRAAAIVLLAAAAVAGQAPAAPRRRRRSYWSLRQPARGQREVDTGFWETQVLVTWRRLAPLNAAAEDAHYIKEFRHAGKGGGIVEGTHVSRPHNGQHPGSCRTCAKQRNAGAVARRRPTCSLRCAARDALLPAPTRT